MKPSKCKASSCLASDQRPTFLRVSALFPSHRFHLVVLIACGCVPIDPLQNMEACGLIRIFIESYERKRVTIDRYPSSKEGIAVGLENGHAFDIEVTLGCGAVTPQEWELRVIKADI